MGVPTYDWPEYTPYIDLTLSVASGGTLSVASGSELVNYDDYTAVNDKVKAHVYVNDSKSAVITFSATDGAMTMSPSTLSVSAADNVEVRFAVYIGTSLPWYTTGTLERRAYWNVPSSLPASVVFNSTNNPMPIPTLDIAFGWEAADKFKVGFKVTDDDDGSQDLTCGSRLAGTCPNKSSQTDIDLASSSTQTHTSTFTKSDLVDGWTLVMFLKSGTGTTRQEERVLLTFLDEFEVDDYPTGFPTSDVTLAQTKVGAAAKLAEP